MRTIGTEVVRDRGTTRAPSPLHALSPAPRAFPERGFSLPELLLVVAILGISALVAMAAWNNFLRKSEAMSAARLTQKYLSQARMLSVYRGVYHFVVIDPTAKTISIYEDSSSPFQKFDNGDTKVDGEPWPTSISMALPAGVSSLPNPLGGSTITNAWTIAVPDATARWGSTLKGVMGTPNGAIDTAEATPAVVMAGVIVFSDASGQITSVGIRGQMGGVKSYRYDGTNWQVM